MRRCEQWNIQHGVRFTHYLTIPSSAQCFASRAALCYSTPIIELHPAPLTASRDGEPILFYPQRRDGPDAR
jgi:hypothetical protein